MPLGLQQNRIIECFKKHKPETDWFALIDESILDKSLHFQENLQNLADKYNIDLKVYAKDEIEHYNNQALQQEQKHYDATFKKELKKLIKDTPNIDKYYYKLYGYLNTLIKSKETNGLIVLGETALGKSYQIIKYLEKNKVNWEGITTFSSPLELYQKLYEAKDKQVILLDDLIKVLDNDVSKGILLSALWGVGKRFVEYNTTSQKLKVPSKFELKAKIILISNELPSKMENILSRVLFYDLNFSYRDRIKLIYEVCRINNIDLKVGEFIEQNTNETTKTEFLNLRTPIKFNCIFKNNSNWKSLCLEQLKVNENMKIIYDLLQQDMTEKSRVQEFTELTGHSRRQYFYLKKKIVQNKYCTTNCTSQSATEPENKAIIYNSAKVQ